MKNESSAYTELSYFLNQKETARDTQFYLALVHSASADAAKNDRIHVN